MGKRKPRPTKSLFIQAVDMIITALLFVVSWASIFVEIPQIKDWRWGILISFLLFVGFALWYFLDMQKRINGLEDENEQLRDEIKEDKNWTIVKLKISPKVNSETKMTLDRMWTVTTARLAITNDEKTEITDCYATLESAEYYQPSYFRPLPVYSDIP